ncbi:MAG: hypothetical protein AAF408_18900, partial [Pseudomonadota bacterium]
PVKHNRLFELLRQQSLAKQSPRHPASPSDLLDWRDAEMLKKLAEASFREQRLEPREDLAPEPGCHDKLLGTV